MPAGITRDTEISRKFDLVISLLFDNITLHIQGSRSDQDQETIEYYPDGELLR